MKKQELKTAIHEYFKAFNRFKELGVVRNKKDFTSQIGVWLVQEVYGGERAKSGIQKYWDMDTSIGKIQVKTHSKAETTKARWSAIKMAKFSEKCFIVSSRFHNVESHQRVSTGNSSIRESRNRINLHKQKIKSCKSNVHHVGQPKN